MLDLSRELGVGPIAVAAGNRTNHELNRAMARHFIAQVIMELHKEDLSPSILDYIEEGFPLIVDRLDALKTEICSPSGSFYNEGTLNGTQQVHQDIILNKLRYGVPKKTSSSTETEESDTAETVNTTVSATTTVASSHTIEANQI
jgi:hypothetical protein